MEKILEVIVIFFFMIGFLTIMGIIINYCVDLWFEQPKEMESQQIGYSEEDIKPLLSFIRDIKDDWDCDNDSHKYGTSCRCCDAKKTLEQFKKK